MLTHNSSRVIEGSRQTKPYDAPLHTFDADAETLSVLNGDRTPVIVTEVSGIDQFASLSTPYHYADDGFYFTKETSEFGNEIWVSDGTQSGTVPVDLNPGMKSSDPELILWEGNTLVIADAPGVGRELWTITAQPRVPGDANGDSVVDTQDFRIVSQNYGKTAQMFSDGDFDGNGLVDFSDFLILADQFAG